MNNLDTADSKPCQYYSYSIRESVVTEVCKHFLKINNNPRTFTIVFCFIRTNLYNVLVEFSL